MKLERLSIQNFKGIKSLELEFDRKKREFRIVGGNGTGKTSVYDAYCWLLTGRNSHESTKFSILPIINKETDTTALVEVEGHFDFNHKLVKFKKLLVNDSVTYFVNDRKRPAGEYEETLLNTLDVDDLELFKILSKPDYFTSMHWKDQRRWLVRLTKEVTIEALAEKYEIAAKLKDFMYNDTLIFDVEKLKTMLREQQRTLKKDLDAYPIKISQAEEYMGNRNDTTKENFVEINKLLDSLRSERDQLDKETIDFHIELRELYQKEANIKSEAQKKHNKELSEYQEEVYVLNSEISKLENRVNTTKREMSNVKERGDDFRAFASDLKNQIIEELEKEISTVCQYCHSTITDESVLEEQRALKQKKVAELRDRYDEMKSLLNSKAHEYKELQKSIQGAEAEIKKKKSLLDVLLEMKPKLDEEIPAELVDRIHFLQLEIRQNTDSTKKDLLESSIRKAEEKREEILADLQKNESFDEWQERIEQYKKEMTEKSRELGKVEEYLDITDEYNLLKAKELEIAVNSHFRNIEFSLFTVYKNGNTKENCEAMVNGVPYADVNRAGKLNAGLNIINVYSQRYDAYTPVFIDNREGIQEIIETTSPQVINLEVYPSDLQMIELNEKPEAWDYQAEEEPDAWKVEKYIQSLTEAELAEVRGKNND